MRKTRFLQAESMVSLEQAVVPTQDSAFANLSAIQEPNSAGESSAHFRYVDALVQDRQRTCHMHYFLLAAERPWSQPRLGGD